MTRSRRAAAGKGAARTPPTGDSYQGAKITAGPFTEGEFSLSTLRDLHEAKLAGRPVPPKVLDRIWRWVNLSTSNRIMKPMGLEAARRLGLSQSALGRLLDSVLWEPNPSLVCGLRRVSRRAPYQVVVYSGVTEFLFFLAQATASRTRFTEPHSPGLVGPPLVPRIRQAMEDVLRRFWGEGVVSPSLDIIGDLDRDQRIFAAQLQDAALAFCFGHEWGHLTCRESKKVPEELVWTRGMMREFPEPGTWARNHKGWRQAWADELAADIIALDYVRAYWFFHHEARLAKAAAPTGVAPASFGWELMVLTAGSLLFLVGCKILEEWAIRRKILPDAAPTHPYSEIRLENLKLWLTRNQDPVILELANLIETIQMDLIP